MIFILAFAVGMYFQIGVWPSVFLAVAAAAITSAGNNPDCDCEND